MRAVFLFALLLPMIASAGIDDPGEKKITVGSEIARGFSVTGSAATNSGSAYLLDAAVAMQRAIESNKATQNDSPGFMLGAKFGLWFNMYWRLEKPSRVVNSQSDIDSCKKGAISDFKDFRRIQTEMGVSDVDLFKVVGITKPDSTMRDIANWEAAHPR